VFLHRRDIYHGTITDACAAALSDDGASSGDEEIHARTAKTDEIEEVEAEQVEEDGSEGGDDQPDE
jgi:hypothetical protein